MCITLNLVHQDQVLKDHTLLIQVLKVHLHSKNMYLIIGYPFLDLIAVF